MEINKIVEYIEAPYNMQIEDFEDLKSLVEEYPFFNTANMLYVKASHNINTDDYAALIARVSASVPNRELLFKLINFSAPVKTDSQKTKVKKEESDTRKEIRERIQQRKKSRMIQKGEILYNHGSSIHEKIVKNFFNPIIDELKKDENNIGIMPDKIGEYFPVVESPAAKSSALKSDEKLRKAIERENRMEAKLKKRIEEQKKISPDVLNEEKAEREKRRLEREKRMEERRLKNKEVSENTEKNVIEGGEKSFVNEEKDSTKSKEIKDQKTNAPENISITIEDTEQEKTDSEVLKNERAERDRRRLERENRMKERRLKREAETQNKEKEVVVDKVSEAKDRFTNIIDLGNTEKIIKDKVNLSTSAENSEITKEKDDISSESASDDLIIIVEEEPDIKTVDAKSEKQEIKNEEILEKPEETVPDNENNKTTKSEKSKPTNIITEDITYSQDENEKNIDLDDIYDKIISSKKPAKKEKNNFIEIKEDVTGLVDEKTDVKKEETHKITKEPKSEEFSSDTDDIEFEIEETSELNEPIAGKEISDRINVDENEKEVESKVGDEIFELIEKEDDKKDALLKEKEDDKKAEVKEEPALKKDSEDSKKKTEEESKDIETDTKLEINKEEAKAKAKAAESVFARIEAFKKKRAESSEKDENKSIKSDDNKNNLINKFVKEEPEIKRSSELDEIDEKIESAGKVSVERKPVVTELMAGIYLNQGKNDEAIEVYEKLILRNPEKKAYFAAKIDEIKKLNN